MTASPLHHGIRTAAATEVQRIARGLIGRLRATRSRARAETIYSDEEERWRGRVSGAQAHNTEDDEDETCGGVGRLATPRHELSAIGEVSEAGAAAELSGESSTALATGLSNASTRCASPHAEMSPLEEEVFISQRKSRLLSRLFSRHSSAT